MELEKKDIKYGLWNCVWYNISTKMEKFLLMMSTILLSIIMLLIICLCVILAHSQENICWSSNCIHQSATMLQYLNQSADPCQDFYEFACGNTFEHNALKYEPAAWTNKIKETALSRMEILIEELEDDDTHPSFLLRQFYKICKHKLTNSEVLNTVRGYLTALGGWPVLGEDYWKDISFSWLNAAYRAKKMGINADFFIDINVEVNYGDPAKYIISIDKPPALRMYNVLLSEHVQKRAYYNFIVNIAVSQFGIEKNTALKELKNVVEFVFKLSKYGLTEVQRNNYTSMYNIRTIKDLQHKYPSINWLQYIKNTIGIFQNDIVLHNEESIMVKDIKYLKEVVLLLSKTPKRVQANYMMLQIVLTNLKYLEPDVVVEHENIYKIITGKFNNVPLWTACVKYAWERLPLVGDVLYSSHYFDKSMEEGFDIISSAVKRQFRKSVMDNDWFDDNTKVAILEKIDLLTIYLGYPKEFLNHNYIKDVYSSMNFENITIIEAVQQLDILITNYNYQRLRQPVKTFDELDAIRSINLDAPLTYSTTKNSVVIPVIFADQLLYDEEVPLYLRFATLGFTIASEISQVLSYKGVQFNGFGKLEDIWWSQETKLMYSNKLRCLTEVYGFREVYEASNTISNMIAVECAYHAYQEEMRKESKQSLLPGLEFNPNEIFWIIASQLYCSTDYSARNLQLGHSQTPLPSLLYSIESFTNDFNCISITKLDECKIL